MQEKKNELQEDIHSIYVFWLSASSPLRFCTCGNQAYGRNVYRVSKFFNIDRQLLSTPRIFLNTSFIFAALSLTTFKFSDRIKKVRTSISKNEFFYSFNTSNLYIHIFIYVSYIAWGRFSKQKKQRVTILLKILIFR